MGLDERNRELERAALIVAPEVVRWINALRQSGQILPAAREADVARSRELVLGEALVREADRPTDPLIQREYRDAAQVGLCPWLDRHDRRCDRAATRAIVFHDNVGRGVTFGCVEHCDGVRELVAYYIVPLQPRDVPQSYIVDIRAPQSTQLSAAFSSEAHLLPRVLRRAYVHPQRMFEMTCQYAPRVLDDGLCGVAAARRIRMEGRFGGCIYGCEEHASALFAQVREALSIMQTEHVISRAILDMP